MRVLAIRDAAARNRRMPNRRSPFASVSIMRRSCDDFRRAMLAAVHVGISTAVKQTGKSAATLPITRRARRRGPTTNNSPSRRELTRSTFAELIRQHFSRITLPWSDEGYLLLPAHSYSNSPHRPQEFERVFSQSVEKSERFTRPTSKSPSRMNGLFARRTIHRQKFRANIG